MIHVDTSALIGSVAGMRPALPVLRRLIADGERVTLSTLVLYEWRCGPRTDEELADQERICPARQAVPFGVEDAVIAAELYQRVRRGRNRSFDLAIAACALSRGAALWTLNPRDFQDIPGLDLV